jgi:hypothetical protein
MRERHEAGGFPGAASINGLAAEPAVSILLWRQIRPRGDGAMLPAVAGEYQK